MCRRPPLQSWMQHASRCRRPEPLSPVRSGPQREIRRPALPSQLSLHSCCSYQTNRPAVVPADPSLQWRRLARIGRHGPAQLRAPRRELTAPTACRSPYPRRCRPRKWWRLGWSRCNATYRSVDDAGRHLQSGRRCRRTRARRQSRSDCSQSASSSGIVVPTRVRLPGLMPPASCCRRYRTRDASRSRLPGPTSPPRSHDRRRVRHVGDGRRIHQRVDQRARHRHAGRRSAGSPR